MKNEQIIYWSYILIDRRFSFKALLFLLLLSPVHA